jgi:hypothetical protein
MARVPEPGGRQHEELAAKKPPAPSVSRGRAVTTARKIVEEIDEVHTRARTAVERGYDLVRCMGCGRLAELPISQRGRRLRCTQCGAAGLNISMIEPDPGQPAERTRRKAAR